MLRKEDWMEIKAQIDKGVYQKDIARQLGVHPKTIRRALRRGGAPPVRWLGSVCRLTQHLVGELP